jgi:ADP-ribose pyrophosphatase
VQNSDSPPRDPAARADEVPAPPQPFAPFQRLFSERIYDSPWCGLRRDQVRLPNGAQQEYHVIEISDAVAVVPVLANGDVVLIGQYRYPHGKTHWEIPAGRMNPGESPRAAAERELREEAGLKATRLVELPGFYPTNGISAHYAHAFIAEACSIEAEPTPEASEQLFRRVFTRAQVEALLDAGSLADAFTALCVAYWLRRTA